MLQNEVLLAQAATEYRIMIRKAVCSDRDDNRPTLPDFNSFALVYVKEHQEETRAS